MQKTIRVVIAEDDSGQAAGLKAMVAEIAPTWDVQVATDWPSCIDLVEEAVPHVLLLDLHMPGGPTGSIFEALSGLSHQPVVIVTTGDPAFALQAFDVDALDYLIKPIRKLRLARAIATATVKLHANKAESTRLHGSDIRGAMKWLTASRGQDAVIVDPGDIVFLQAERTNTRLLTVELEAILHMGISEVERLLDDLQFCRISRSAIVNPRHIQYLRRDEMGRLRVHLKGRAEKLIVSPSFAAQFKTL